jgi:glutamate-1-semialdehyde aminotransferase
MSDEPGGADLAVDAFGVKANIKNIKSPNTLLTFYTAVVSTVVAVFIGMHTVHARDDAKAVAQQLEKSNREVANALRDTTKEQSAATLQLVKSLKMQNCLTVRIRPEMSTTQRNEERTFCENITR